VDANRNGVQDSGEANVQGVKVTLLNSNGGQVGEAITTNANGNYAFSNLMPGSYYVKFDPATLPSGFIFTTAKAAGVSDDRDSDADASGKTANVTLNAGQNHRDLDAGIMQPAQPALASLGDIVWFDANKNGIQDNGEQGVAGVEVKLYAADGNFVKSAITGNDGKYLFTDLLPGSYYVEFANVPGHVFTRYNIGTNGMDSDDSLDATDSDPLVPWVGVGISNGGVEAELGAPLTFTFFYSNTSDNLAATNVVISTTVPAGTSFVAASSDPGWSCPNPTAGSVCTLTVKTLAAGANGSATFVLLLDANEPAVPDMLDLFVSVTQGTVARTRNVTLAAGENNFNFDAGIVRIESSLQTATPTDPTNLPPSEQPQQGRKNVFLPTVRTEK
jgi:uncharacterized repeat protein (TIGR01451 family)